MQVAVIARRGPAAAVSRTAAGVTDVEAAAPLHGTARLPLVLAGSGQVLQAAPLSCATSGCTRHVAG